MVFAKSNLTKYHSYKMLDPVTAFLGHFLGSCVCFGFAVKLGAQIIKIVDLLHDCPILHEFAHKVLPERITTGFL